MKLRLFFQLFILNIVAFIFVAGSFADQLKPEPGRQVPQSVELSASTSTWVMGSSGLNGIGEPRPVDSDKKETVRFWLFLPADYDPQSDKQWPLLLFLHGAGERGDSDDALQKVKVHGPPKKLDQPEFAQKFPFITVSPQCRPDHCWSPGQLMELLDVMEKNYRIDLKRVFVTGLSMGGFGTWMCLNEAPNRFAAAIPVCGGAKTDWADRVATVPTWIFHGTSDSLVPAKLSSEIHQAVRDKGVRNSILTLYEGVDHNSWTRTYDNQLIYDWLLSKKRNQ